MNRCVLSASRCLIAALVTACLVTGSQAEPNVTVLNTGANPLPTRGVDNPVFTPYQATIAPLEIQQAGQGFADFPAVPAGSRLVVQHVSVFTQIVTGTIVLAQIRNDAGAKTSFFVPVAPANGGPRVATVDQSVQLYFDGGTVPHVTYSIDAGSLNTVTGAFVTISGYLVSCTGSPACSPIAP